MVRRTNGRPMWFSAFAFAAALAIAVLTLWCFPG